MARLRNHEAAPRRVQKLCLLATTAEEDSPEKRAARQTMMEQVRQGYFAEVAHALVESFTYQQAGKDRVHAMLLRNEDAFCLETD